MEDPLGNFGDRPCRHCGHIRDDHSSKGGCLHRLTDDGHYCRCDHPRRELGAFGLRQRQGEVVPA